ncbi:hypothetical protein N7478_008581 [Penicillium angulare]|uniref:uncharacterized protein n=1 Tax=Penicillium angulare TaxID=116970 RepID=UPI002540DA73|nr:uncharacterized protein N7478_008581 [Penicillium angulare]KAJ5273456.1 hypothetical protein N7478_008581 [Penicillium angulare]
MQRSWRQDADKLTFISCRPVSQSRINATDIHLVPEDEAAQNMVGDINLFLRVDDGDEGDAPPQLIGEIELMIAEKANQGHGFGKASLLVFLRYVVEQEARILDEFVGSLEAGEKEKLVQGQELKFHCLSVKIGKDNSRSLALFESLGFVKVSVEPNFFGEFELRRADLGVQGVSDSLAAAGVERYVELAYERKE